MALIDSYTAGTGNLSNATAGHYDGGSGYRRKAMAYQPSVNHTPTGLEIEIKIVAGTVNNNTYVAIFDDSSGKPGTQVTNAIYTATSPSAAGWFGSTFPSAPTTELLTGTQYWLVLEAQISNASSYYHIDGENSGGESDGVKGDEGTGPSTYSGTWTGDSSANERFNFKVYGDLSSMFTPRIANVI